MIAHKLGIESRSGAHDDGRLRRDATYLISFFCLGIFTLYIAVSTLPPMDAEDWAHLRRPRDIAEFQAMQVGACGHGYPHLHTHLSHTLASTRVQDSRAHSRAHPHPPRSARTEGDAEVQGPERGRSADRVPVRLRLHAVVRHSRLDRIQLALRTAVRPDPGLVSRLLCDDVWRDRVLLCVKPLHAQDPARALPCAGGVPRAEGGGEHRQYLLLPPLPPHVASAAQLVHQRSVSSRGHPAPQVCGRDLHRANADQLFARAGR